MPSSYPYPNQQGRLFESKKLVRVGTSLYQKSGNQLIRQKDKAEASEMESKADKTSDHASERGGHVGRSLSTRGRGEGRRVTGAEQSRARAQGYSYLHSSREIAWRLQRRERVLDQLPPEQGKKRRRSCTLQGIQEPDF
mmetsp:Transcript_24315/g.79368  ORF Transcript_24315/g.79368 Transcript_24315/m.79368 type:complete len:139 (+) Transcript_24315:1-417(+)